MPSYQIYHKRSHSVPEQLRRGYNIQLATECQINGKIPTVSSSSSPHAPQAYAPASKWHSDEKLTVLWVGDTCPTSSISLLGEFAFSLALSLYCSPDTCAHPILFAKLRDLHHVIISELPWLPFFYIFFSQFSLPNPVIFCFVFFWLSLWFLSVPVGIFWMLCCMFL